MGHSPAPQACLGPPSLLSVLALPVGGEAPGRADLRCPPQTCPEPPAQAGHTLVPWTQAGRAPLLLEGQLRWQASTHLCGFTLPLPPRAWQDQRNVWQRVPKASAAGEQRSSVCVREPGRPSTSVRLCPSSEQPLRPVPSLPFSQVPITANSLAGASPGHSCPPTHMILLPPHHWCLCGGKRQVTPQGLPLAWAVGR